MSSGQPGGGKVRFAIYANGVKEFLKDTFGEREMGSKGIPWLLRAAHHLRGKEYKVTGAEDWPEDSALEASAREWLGRLAEQAAAQPEVFAPKPPRAGHLFNVYIFEVDRDEAGQCEAFLSPLHDLRLTHGGRLDVLRVPEDIKSRESQQDRDKAVRWTWGTLMPLYFRTIGAQEPQWNVTGFKTRWDGDRLVVLEDTHEFFASSILVALLDVLDDERVRVLTLFQEEEEDPRRATAPVTHTLGSSSSSLPTDRGCWALPGGSVDRATDSDLMDAARRELQEEVNPANVPGWAVPLHDNCAVLTVQNLLPRTDAQNMSRPCLTFVVVRAPEGFARTVEEAPAHEAGGKCLTLPPDFVTEMPSLRRDSEAQKWAIRRFWDDGSMPFVEHDRCDWVTLNTHTGSVEETQPSVHRYVSYLASALQQAPRSPELVQVLSGVGTGRRGRGPPDGAEPHVRANPFGEARPVVALSRDVDALQASDDGLVQVSTDKQLQDLFAAGRITKQAMLDAKQRLKEAGECVVSLCGSG